MSVARSQAGRAHDASRGMSAGRRAATAAAGDPADAVSAIVVVILTLGCTALAIYDLVLLAATSAPR